MKRIILLIAVSLLCGGPMAVVAAEQAKEAGKLSTFQEKLSYSMGLDVGTYFKGMGDDIAIDTLMKGIQDAYGGSEKLLTEEEIAAVQKEYAEKMQARQAQKMKELQEKNKKAGLAFLEENKKKKGVVVTKSGLQYEVLKQGDGPKPKATDTVKVDYVGTLVDGKEFDNSIKRGEPAVFSVGQVIPGWSEALQLMNVGSKYKIVIPSDLAYGDNGAPPVIEPGAVLVFEVDLRSIEQPAAKK
ncbi:FKBP-type peptidyl-prolyl cis-trans isomerase [Desulfoprunum benzoelyticum]|uniref:Peptidyl-prolyl cis-trans isomerase n=1 Tax=Desulfoprunum benzoelyticum TaxID=1506996 RepID=A0A840UU44_9BACT|nr:FKBP-type peptidyl-prolyl cis-trans isomerase [Desulfoprunum benzoelyticum]MBB5348356.1 peptidylprolyl isomerase/FKBP-type peptidyl-prolyl cis-trans isomerase FklB [Desulfoprunum benzoelyticum]MBM9528784.1 FKBP-type peptidyl-prolyl cis-trans isomerase [Desulfoprunum benzoelyticum]